MNKNVKHSLLILALLIVTALVISMWMYLFIQKKWIYIFGGLAYFVFTLLLPNPKRNRYYKVIHCILYLPTNVLYFTVSLVIPIIALTANIATYLFAAGIWVGLILACLKIFNIIPISGPMILYISMTLISIVSIVRRENLLNFVYKHSITRLNESKNMNRIKIKELTEGIITQKTVRFSIYFLYFVYIIMYSFCDIENIKVMDEKYNIAVLQAFITFLAFDNIILNCSDIKDFPSRAYYLILDSLRKSFHLDDEEADK